MLNIFVCRYETIPNTNSVHYVHEYPKQHGGFCGKWSSGSTAILNDQKYIKVAKSIDLIYGLSPNQPVLQWWFVDHASDLSFGTENFGTEQLLKETCR